MVISDIFCVSHWPLFQWLTQKMFCLFSRFHLPPASKSCDVQQHNGQQHVTPTNNVPSSQSSILFSSSLRLPTTTTMMRSGSTRPVLLLLPAALLLFCSVLILLGSDDPVTKSSTRRTSTTAGTSDPPITFYIRLESPGGLGNKVSALVGALALARASGRRSVAISGSGVIWRRFWESSSSSSSPDAMRLVYEDPPLDPHYTCTTRNLLDQDHPCHAAIFDDAPDSTVIVVTIQNFGESLQAALSHPQFERRYLDAVRQIHGSVSSSNLNSEAMWGLLFTMEMPMIFYKPTEDFVRNIESFGQEHGLSDASAGGYDDDGSAIVPSQYRFDMALHVRRCVDCGWTMTNEAIRDNVQCALEAYQAREREPLSTIFLTADTRDVIPIVESVLPKGTKLVENIPASLTHTDRIRADDPSNFDTLAAPYLDNYMLGQSRWVGSCWTSFGQIGASRSGGGLERLDHVIVWQHHPGKRKCWPLLEAGGIDSKEHSHHALAGATIK